MIAQHAPPSAAQTGRIAAALYAEERLIWSARPRARDELRLDGTIWALPLGWFGLSASVTGFLAYADAHRLASVAPDAAWSMVPFLLIGLALLVRPWRAAYRALGAVYALTDRRLMRLDASGAVTNQIVLADLGPIESDEGLDGYGTLHIRLRQIASNKGRGIVYWRLRGVPELREVRQRIAAGIAPRA